eukprot:2363982-Pyramimonas_sp.AAC.1
MRSMPKSSCTMPIHPRSERRALTSRPPPNALYFAWGKSNGSNMDAGVAPGSSPSGYSAGITSPSS